MTDNRMVLNPVCQFGYDGAEERRALDLVFGDAGQALDKFGDRTSWVDEGLEGV